MKGSERPMKGSGRPVPGSGTPRQGSERPRIAHCLVGGVHPPRPAPARFVQRIIDLPRAGWISMLLFEWLRKQCDHPAQGLLPPRAGWISMLLLEWQRKQCDHPGRNGAPHPSQPLTARCTPDSNPGGAVHMLRLIRASRVAFFQCSLAKLAE